MSQSWPAAPSPIGSNGTGNPTRVIHTPLRPCDTCGCDPIAERGHFKNNSGYCHAPRTKVGEQCKCLKYVPQKAQPVVDGEEVVQEPMIEEFSGLG